MLLSEEENCQLVTVTEEEINNCVRVIPRLDTLILVKAMGHRKRFGNPFRGETNPRASPNASTQSLRGPRKKSCRDSSVNSNEIEDNRETRFPNSNRMEKKSENSEFQILLTRHKNFKKTKLNVSLTFIDMCFELLNLRKMNEKNEKF